MDELFDAHFWVGHRQFTYRLGHDQAARIYQTLGSCISTGKGSEGIDLKFSDTDDLDDATAKTFKIDSSDAFNLYRRLGTWLQKRYPGNGPLIQLHEAAS